MEAPRLLKNESAASFKARVTAWEMRTGKKYPRTFGGKTNEERILGGAIQNRGLNILRDYSKDYNLDDQAKEEFLSGSFKKYSESKEGKEFAKQQLTIQEAVDQTKKEASYTQKFTDPYKAVLNKSQELAKNKPVVPEETKPNSKTSEKIPIPGSENAVKEGGNVKETSNREQLKSDVFTINPETGEAVGVLTKAQRKAFDKRYQKDLQENRNKLRTYTIKGKEVKRYG